MLHFEWDERKNRANEKKHGVDFKTRWHALGLVENLIILVVAHTYRGEVTRIISARPASSHERRLYAEAIG
jgi:uncharacterized DUF497 family protein